MCRMMAREMGLMLLKKSRQMTTALFLFVVYTAYADAVVTFSPGAAFSTKGETQTLLIEGPPQNLSNQYVADNSGKSAFMTQLFVGKTLFTYKKTSMYIGAMGTYLDNLNVTGVVNQFAMPDFDNFNFQYTTRSAAFFASARLESLFYELWRPYLNASLGASQNKSYAYQDTPRIEGAVPMLPFSNHTETSLAYSLGFGFFLNAYAPLTLGLGYEFTDLGQSQLGVSPSQTTQQTMTLNHLYLNRLLIHFNLVL